MSDSSIMSVGEMIELAFGDPETNTVNFRLIQAILYLLARQLRLLERRVAIEIGYIPLDTSSSSVLSVTEVKIHANVPKKSRKKVPAGADRVDKEPYSGKISSGKAKTVKKSTGRRDQDYDEHDELHDEKGSFDKRYTGGPGAKLSSEISADKQTDNYNEESSRKKITKPLDKAHVGKSQTSGKAYDDKSTSSKIGKHGKKSFDKGSPGRSQGKTERTEYSDRSTSDRKASEDKISPGRKQDKTDGTSGYEYSDKSRSDKASTRKSDKTTDKSLEESLSAGYKKKKYTTILEKIEEKRERVLRVIHQRADSHEEGKVSPSPMASMESTEMKYEKLLIVERLPSEEATKRKDVHRRTPRLSLVTQEQFEQLVRSVIDLESQFGPVGTATFPGNLQLMEELRKDASLTDAMAALQLSARLEAAEQALERMFSLLTDLAGRTPDMPQSVVVGAVKVQSKAAAGTVKAVEIAGPEGVTDKWETTGAGTEVVTGSKETTKTLGIHEQAATDDQSETHLIFEKALDTISQKIPVSSVLSSRSVASSKKSAHQSQPDKDFTMSRSFAQSLAATAGDDRDDNVAMEMDTNRIQLATKYITHPELEAAVKEMRDELFNLVTKITAGCTANSANAIKIANRAEGKIDESLNFGTRMNDLENAVSTYVEQINILDTGLSSQITNYQEQLTQMQHDLEMGLDNMAEALANQVGDTEAVVELNTHFTSLQMDFESTKLMQTEFDEVQQGFSIDLQSLWKEIEILRDSKADRDEVTDALRDKAGIGVLNGMVTLHQFDAVRGDFEKRISAAYDKFNNQEIIWQKAIDDLLREINEKSDVTQVESLRDDVNRKLNMMTDRVNAMLDLVGEPQAAAISKRIFRDSACLSCSTPAHLAMEEPDLLPTLPPMPKRPQTIGEESPPKLMEDGDHGACYTGLPIPHPVDARSKFCTRYCGGSHTAISNAHRTLATGLNVTRLSVEPTIAVGSDGKTYKVDEEYFKQPCLPCNEPRSKPTTKMPISVSNTTPAAITVTDFYVGSILMPEDDS